jgi:hypothetical protein
MIVPMPAKSTIQMHHTSQTVQAEHHHVKLEAQYSDAEPVLLQHAAGTQHHVEGALQNPLPVQHSLRS